MRFLFVSNSTETLLLLKKYALMAVCNWVVCNGACRCMAIVWAIILAPRHRSSLCGLIDGRVLVDASSGCPVIGRAVETGRLGRGMVALVVAGGDMPHWIEIVIVFMNWLITLYCFYICFCFFLTSVTPAQRLPCIIMYVEIRDK